MILPIIPRRKIVNRQDRRLFENESRRISSQLLHIPMEFLQNIFSEDEDEYIILYNTYNELWMLGCEFCKSLHPKLKICDPNPYFFEVTFRPLEHPGEQYFLDNLLKTLRNEKENREATTA